MRKTKIGYFADGPWSHNAFDLLVKDESIEICFIVPRSDSLDSILYDYSLKYNIIYLKGYNINSDEFYEITKHFHCDLFISMSFNQIFKQKILTQPMMGAINCHAGKLPFYRGRNILNWALINDEKEFGITVHFIDTGIDTGDIILQRCFPISEKDNYSTLLNISYIECAKVLYDAIKLLQKGSYTRIKQKDIHPVGFYCGQRKIGDEKIIWDQKSRDIFNFIRAICTPGPRATSTINGNKVFINQANLIQDAVNYKCILGQVISKTEKGYLVKTQDNLIEIYDINVENNYTIKIGDRFN